MNATKRVIFNTGFLYTRMLITIVVSLYSTRLILSALGEDDFGTFNLVAGVIGMLNFLNAAMTVTTQRYLSFNLGSGDNNKVKYVFASSVTLHLFIGILIVILLEVAGIFLFKDFLNIPESRVFAAKVIYHFMVVSTFFTINAVPYDGAINAHEHLHIEAFLGVFEALAKLGIAIWLLQVQSDKLIVYGISIAALVIFIRIIKSVYCYISYSECRSFRYRYFDLALIKEMFSFAGWNLFGSFCHVLRNQGLAVILNIFFSVVVNAAYGIANQVNGQLSSFSANMLKALNPQIVKSEGGNNRERMLRLATFASKLSVFLMIFFSLPLLMEMKYVLGAWLKDYPQYSVEFCRLILIVSLTTQLTVGLQPAIQSIGKIKAYQVVVGLLLMMNVPLAFLLVKLGLPPYSVFVGSIGLEIVAGGLRIWFAKHLAGLDVKTYVFEIVLRSVSAIVLASVVAFLPRLFFEEGFIRLVITTLVSSLAIFIFGRFIALSKDESDKVKEIVVKLRSKRRLNAKSNRHD